MVALAWIANALGIAENFPWRHPFVGLFLEITSALISFFANSASWSWIMLGIAVVFAVWACLENLNNEIAGFMAGILGTVTLMGLSVVFNILIKTPHGRAMFNVINHQVQIDKIQNNTQR